MITYATFTTAFPEFTDATLYPETQVDFWIPVAYSQLSSSVLGDSLDLAAMLFVAHNIVLSARNTRTSGVGGIVGDSVAPTASKSVGPVSVSYDTSDAAIQGAGEWNATSYGQRLYKMFKAFGTGPLYVVSPCGLNGAGRLIW